MPPQIPHFHLHPNKSVATVTHWGVADGLLFTPGDRLLLGELPHNDRDDSQGLVVLRPRGFGAVMLGRRIGGHLLGEPGGVPASPLRWECVGSVIAVERPLTRAAGSLRVLGVGSWLVSGDEHTEQDWVSLDRHLQRLSATTQDEGVVVGRSLLAALALPPRPGWIRYVLLPPAADVLTGPWQAADSNQPEAVRFSKAG